MKTLGVRFLVMLSIFLTVVSAVITYLNVLQKKEETAMVIHHYHVIQVSTHVLSLMKDMEIGLRGYLITSDTIFLQPYETAVKTIDHDLDTLKLLESGNPRQLELLQKKLLPAVNLRRNSLEVDFAILKRFGYDSASHYATMKISKARLDSIRFWTARFIDHEKELLTGRIQSLDQTYLINDVIRFSSFMLIGLISFAALVTITNKEKDNKRLLAELQEFNQQLEEKVKIRTRELEVANRNLVRLNEEKNNFLGITTHDLKAPLAGISGLLELMKLDQASLTPTHLDYVILMQRTCDDMQRLISDLLDLSRIEQGTSQVKKSEIDLTALINKLDERFKVWALKKDINLVCQVKEDAKNIVTDPDMLVRILDNLVSNALKFSPKGRAVRLSVTTDNGFTRFEVSDEGPGIRPEERHKLFRKFQKLSSRPTGGESSSGLGLSIARDLTEMLGGTIVVESEFGAGTMFIVKLPV